MRGQIVIFLFIFYTCFVCCNSKQNGKAGNIEGISDAKEFKKILRTKNNILVCFISSHPQASNVLKIFRETAEIIKGQGTMLIADCSGDAKKMCKQLKIVPDPYVLRHYKDGNFHKVYDRKLLTTSLVNFMRDPTGDIPWDEDETSVDVVHIQDYAGLVKLLKREPKPIMIMFYAPWCGYCKQLKPEYSAAATSLRNTSVLAAIDVNRPENTVVRTKFNITGFPTLLYFENGELKHSYEGENKRDKLISFMQDPSAPLPKTVDDEWALSETDVIQLTTDTFDTFVQGERSTLIMFYAPWCGHCKKMKPEYEKAAALMKTEGVAGSLAAVDSTKEVALSKRFGIKGFPTVKYFRDGEFAWDALTLRESGKIVEFMKDPKEPPPPPPPEPDWSEQPSEVVHLTTDNFKQYLKKKKHVLVMFYAPWCGHCKLAKPEFTAAAEESKDNLNVAFAAIDCTKHSTVCNAVGVSGYPTFKYYHYYNKDTTNIEYNGGRKKVDFLNFINKIDSAGKLPSTPVAPPPPVKLEQGPVEKETNIWAGVKGSEKVLRITDNNYKELFMKHESILVLFYDSGCKDCGKLIREYADTAARISPADGVLFACDGKLYNKIALEYNVKTLPVIKYFKGGKFIADYKGKHESDNFLKYIKKPSKVKEEL